MKYITISIFFITHTLSNCSHNSGFTTSLTKYPANGRSTGVLIYNKKYPKDSVQIMHKKNKCIKIITTKVTKFQEKIHFKSTNRPGKVCFLSKSNKKICLTFYKFQADIDNDGIPDSAELLNPIDRMSFRKWFVRIAEAQFLKKNYSWSKNERDCAGLIRYAYKEALKKHDEQWYRKSGISIDKNLSDVRQYNYPHIPILKDKLFKLRKGRSSDLSTFGYFADAETLRKYNMTLISRDISAAQAGDILFYQNLLHESSPHHSMIVVENSGKDFKVVYHTGSGNLVKRVSLNYLKKSSIFQPAKWNKHFLGIYRFNILMLNN